MKKIVNSKYSKYVLFLALFLAGIAFYFGLNRGVMFIVKGSEEAIKTQIANAAGYISSSVSSQIDQTPLNSSSISISSAASSVSKKNKDNKGEGANKSNSSSIQLAWASNQNASSFSSDISSLGQSFFSSIPSGISSNQELVDTGIGQLGERAVSSYSSRSSEPQSSSAHSIFYSSSQPQVSSVSFISSYSSASALSSSLGNIFASGNSVSASVEPQCKLSFNFAPDSKVISVGGVINYKASLKNIGSGICDSSSFSVYYSDFEKFKSSDIKPSASDYYWIAGNLKSNQEYMVSISTVHNGDTSSNQISNEACANAYNGNDACVQNLIFVGSGTSPGSSLSASSSSVASSASASSFGAGKSSSSSVYASSLPSSRSSIFSSSPVSSISSSVSGGFVPPKGKEFGTWIWNSPKEMSDSYMSELIHAVSKNGMNSAYVTIDDYLNISVLPEGKNKDDAKKLYFDSLARLITLANKLGVAIDVEGGAKDWAIAENRWKGYALIDFVKEYNQKYPSAKIRNFQYDVEPYLLSTYENNKASVLKTYIEFIDASAMRMQSADAGFSIVIPHFYDAGQRWTPSISYNGKTTDTFSHLLDILNRKSGNTILIMAYRNFFEGNNGTRQISEYEVKQASAGSNATNIIVAQETGNVDPSYVTFYGFSLAEFLDNLSEIYSGFSSYGNFSGTAAHYIDSFLVLGN